MEMENTFFKIYHPYSSNRLYTILELLFNIKMYSNKSTNEDYVYNVFIKDNVLYTHSSNEITKFIKNNCSYLIYSDNYSKDIEKPLMQVNIYENEIHIKLTSI